MLKFYFMSYLCSSSKLRFTLLSVLVFITTLAFAQNADFSINNASQCQTGNSFIFTNLSSGGSATYQWSFGDGTTSTATNPTKSYSSSGNFSVQLIATIGGSDHYVSKTVSVNPLPQCSFSYLVATGTGNSYTFQSKSTIASGGMNYSWDFGDGGAGPGSNPSHTYSVNGNYTVTLTVTSDQGCVCSTTQNIIVTVSSSSSGCPDTLYSFCVNKSHQCLTGNSFIFTNTSNAPAGTTFSWNFGDGTTSTLASPSKTYTNPGTYIITLTSTYNGTSCYSTKTVVVDNTPVVTINGGNCVGNTLTANFTGTNISNLNWVNGSGNVSSNLSTWSTSGQVVAGGNGAGTMVYPVPIGVTVSQLTVPKGIYLDNNKDLFVIDNYTSRVVKWTPGNSTGISKCYSTQITGVGEDCSGNIYTVDDICNCVMKWAPGATAGVIVAGGNGEGSAANQLDNPRGNLYIDNAGDIYINDTYNNRIQMWAHNATVGVTVAGGNNQGSALNQLNHPHGFFVDDAGNMYVSDAGNFRILKFPPGSTNATYGVVVAGGNGHGMGLNQFNNPFSVYVDNAGNIYVDDISITGNHRIQLWRPLATSGITIMDVPGSYSDEAIVNVWVDVNNGDIYVSDDANSRVMKYSVAGINNTYTTPAVNTYSVVVTTFDGCMYRTSVNVDSLPIVKPITGTNSVCVGNNITLVDSTIGGNWTSLNNNIATVGNSGVVTVVNGGIDTIQYTVTNGGCSNVVTKIITINQLPVFNLSGGTCVGNTLTVGLGGTIPNSLVWNNGTSLVQSGVPVLHTNYDIVAGGNGAGTNANQLTAPKGIYVDKNDNVYVIDNYQSRVQKWVKGADSGITVATCLQCTGLTVDDSGNVFVVDDIHNWVQKFAQGSSTGIVVAGGNGSGIGANQLNNPVGNLYIDSIGDIYINDFLNARIQKWAPGASSGVTVAGGNGAGSASNQLYHPTSFYVDKQGNVFVSDAGNYRIQKWVPGATTGVTVAGGTLGSAPNQFDGGPDVVYLDANANIYAVDHFQGRIQFWPAGDTIGYTMFGGAWGTASADQPFVYVNTTNGDVFTLDQTNNRVLKYTDSAISNTTYTPVTNGLYSVTTTSYAGCTYKTSINISNNPNVKPITGLSSVCAGNTIQLTDSTHVGSWSSTNNTLATVSNNGVVTGVSAGVDTIKYKVISSCGDTSATFVIKINPLSVVIMNNTGNICSGNDTLNLSGASDASKIVWYKNGVAIDTINSTLSDSAVTVATSNALNGTFVDGLGNVDVIDVYGSIGWRILKYAVGATDSSVIAGGNGDGSAQNQFIDAWGVFVDPFGNLYVSDYENNRVLKFPPGSTGATNGVTVAGGNNMGSGTNQLSMPYGVFVDLSGNMYVADAGNSRIMKYAPGSTTGVVVAGGNNMGSAANQLNNPFGVWVDNNGYLYVADGGNNRIQKFPPGSTESTNGITVAGGNNWGTALNQLNAPNNVFVDGNGNIYVSEGNSSRILLFPPNSSSATYGTLLVGKYGRGSAPNQLSSPWGVFIDNNGNLYVGDESNRRVQKFVHQINTSFVPSSAGDYTAVVTTINGCTTTSNTINLSSSTVTPSFIINSVSQCLNGNSFSYTNTSNVCGTASYLWSFGDGTTASTANAVHSYTNPNSYNVTLKITVSGIDYYSSQTVVVSSAPVASFNILAGTGSGNAYTFISSSTINSGYISSYLWSFGDGNTDNTSNPNHIYTVKGTYNVKLIVTSNGGCKDSIIKSFIVTLTAGGGSTPAPSFIVNNAQQCFNINSFVFTNTSSAPTGTTYLWNFGDGSISTSANATHSYTSQGNYNVTLIATYNGIDHYYAQTVWVKPMPVSSFSYFANKQSIYGYTFLSTSTIASGNMTYSWNFGDGTTDSVSNPQHTFTSDGRKDITLVVTSDAGCKDSTTHYQIFCPTMNNKMFLINAASSCLNGNFWGVQNYYGNSIGYPMTYLWDYGDGTTSTLGNPPWHTYATAGNKTITLKVTMAYPGCPVITDSVWDTGIYVDSMPVASFNISGSPATMCFDPSNSYTFNNTSSAPSGTTYLWDFGDTTNSNLTSPSHTYTHPGNQTWDTNAYKINVKLVASSSNYCKDSIVVQVRLYPVPIADSFTIHGIYGTRDQYLNIGPDIYFNNYVLNDTTECFAGYNWYGIAIYGQITSYDDYWKVNFDDGTSGASQGHTPGGSAEGPYYKYTTPGVHNFTGNMVSSLGCLSNTLYGHITLTPNIDTIPHSVIGLHTEITTNVGIDPYGNNYNHYKVFFANMGSTACRPIVASYWRFSYLTGAPFYNHGYYDFVYNGLLPATTDSDYYGFDADPSVTYQIRLITVNDQGRADTAYATVGATNAGYIPFRADIISNSSHIGVFPNPAVQETNIEASADKSTNAVLIVYNSIGQIVSTKRVSMLANLKQSININVSTWAEGIYYVMLKNEQGQIISKSKFIKTIK